MADYSDLKKLAEEVNEAFPDKEDLWNMVCTPSVALHLVADLEQLKVEIKALNDRANYWKQRAKSAEGHLCASDTKTAAMALQARTEFAGEDWGDLSGCQRAKLLTAAATVIGAVNSRRDQRKPGNDSGVIYG